MKHSKEEKRELRRTYNAILERRQSQAVRNGRMKSLREQGWTLADIGKMYNLTRERVRQIVDDPYSHVPKPTKPPRDYIKHEPNGDSMHGSLTGYQYGCRTDEACPANPTCRQYRTEYMRHYNQRKGS